MQQFSEFFYSTFICGSTCFGRRTAHHQEHTTANAASIFTSFIQQRM
jgi:hypothetical protein